MTVWFGIDTDGPREKERDLYSRNAFAIVSLPIFSLLRCYSLDTQQSSKSQSFPFSSLYRIHLLCLSLSLGP